MMDKKEFFCVNVNEYNSDKNWQVCRPASLNSPRDHAVMFVTSAYLPQASALEKVQKCLVFWPEGETIPEKIQKQHAVVFAQDPRTEYCRFFDKHRITNLPSNDPFHYEGGAWISQGAEIGEGCTIFPGAYIGADVKIGNDVYIGSGVRIVGSVQIGNCVVIRENTVIGADGLSTNRDENGRGLTMPQFGGVVIEDHVEIGANAIIARGAIDNTILSKGSKIDGGCYVSHNVIVGEDTFIVGESILFGSVSTGRRVYISGNATIRNGIHLGDDAMIGMGAVVTKPVAKKAVVKGNPAK